MERQPKRQVRGSSDRQADSNKQPRPSDLDLKKRKLRFVQVLGDRIEQELTFDVLRKLTGTALKDRGIQTFLQKLKNERGFFDPGTKLRVGKRSAILTYSRHADTPTTKDVRQRSRPEVKQRLGKVLWKVLFDLPLESPPQDQDFELRNFEAIQPRIAKLRRKSLITFLIDAGSTTQLVAEELLQRPMPLKIALDRSFRLASCRIVTNSPPLAQMVCRSQNRQLIELIVIGGEVRVDRESICGLLTESCLKSWNFVGDCAIIGTTGYRDAGFACDALEEAHLKSAFLRMGTQLRVIAFDSTKIVSEDHFKVFAPLSLPSVHLVVTDDGREKGLEKEVDFFCEQARGEHIGVILVKSDTSLRNQ